jgi:heme/copper-type cytochrome/quinol oxidase subunit 4
VTGLEQLFAWIFSVTCVCVVMMTLGSLWLMAKYENKREMHRRDSSS